jgi:hypothetical protein
MRKRIKKGMAYIMLIVIMGSLLSGCMPNMEQESNEDKEPSNTKGI